MEDILIEEEDLEYFKEALGGQLTLLTTQALAALSLSLSLEAFSLPSLSSCHLSQIVWDCFRKFGTNS